MLPPSRVPMHVVSASRRTDIPAFYLPWFMERCREGYADVRHPVLRGRSYRVDLRPTEVAAIVFWSRSYAVFQRHHRFFRDYELFFHFTINPPHPVFEPHAPPPEAALGQLRFLAETFGAERVVWRYDPLVSWERGGVRDQSFDPEFFRRLASQVAAAGVTRCVTSFADLYNKARRRVREAAPGFALVEPDRSQRRSWLEQMAREGARWGVRIELCCEDDMLGAEGVGKARCIDGELISRLTGRRTSRRKTPTRDQCGCTHSLDVGDYEAQPCPFGCLYCYANPKLRL